MKDHEIVINELSELFRTLSWYAGNKTEEFADQLIAKVRKFQTPEITELFKEINGKCKKENNS
ncbi:hypothetical protein [Flavobacterium sp. FlaQc-48]|uniref:hypothetical protein n=1 Tax=Flavobacterium sp. FlaQc-48 TaxID=3374181 RepID=UPI003757C95C